MHFVKLNLAVTLTLCTLLEGQFGLPKLHSESILQIIPFLFWLFCFALLMVYFLIFILRGIFQIIFHVI